MPSFTFLKSSDFKSGQPIGDQHHSQRLDPIMNFVNAPSEIARFGIGGLYLRVQSVAATPIEVSGLGDGVPDFVSGQVARRQPLPCTLSSPTKADLRTPA